MKLTKQYQKGFTLIEIMIIVAILGIIASIAVPSYMDYVRKGKRADAKVELLRIAQIQESFFVQNLSYAKSLKVEVGGLGLGNTVLSEQEEYEIKLVSAPGGCTGTTATPCTTFTLTAETNGSQDSDAKCKNFSLTNTGVKGVTGTHTVKQCW